MSTLDFMRSYAGRFAAPVVIALAGSGFFFLRNGKVGGGPSGLAYAEVVHHEVGTTVNGRVHEIRVHVGQQVKAGEPLAVLEDRTLLVARERALAQLEKLKADVTAATISEESSVSRAELWVLKTRADEGSDRAELEEVTQQMDRLGGLFERQLIAAGEVESTRQRMSTLTARVKAYDQAIGRGQAGLDKGSGAGHQKVVAARIEPFRQALLVQQAAVKQLDLAIEELTIRAVADGVVSALVHRAGDVVQAGTPIVSLVTSRPRMLVAILPESAATKVTMGSKAELRRAAIFAPVMAARVVELAPEVEEIPVRARPSPSTPAWGRRVTIELQAETEILPGEGFHVAFR
jgi:HlyD family secretion protein